VNRCIECESTPRLVRADLSKHVAGGVRCCGRIPLARTPGLRQTTGRAAGGRLSATRGACLNNASRVTRLVFALGWAVGGWPRFGIAASCRNVVIFTPDGCQPCSAT
jgi:hypothetical protein